MKKRISLVLAFVLILVSVFALFSCGGNTDNKDTDSNESPEAPQGLWASAAYTENTVLGEGNTEFTFKVKADEKVVTFTIRTDKTVLGDALFDHGLIAGEPGAYGLYVKKVNGILADYDVDRHYWSLWIGNTYAPTGADSTEIKAGETYTFERAK